MNLLSLMIENYFYDIQMPIQRTLLLLSHLRNSNKGIFNQISTFASEIRLEDFLSQQDNTE